MIREPLNTHDALDFAKTSAPARRRFSSGGPPCAKLLALSLERLKIALCFSAM